MTGIFAVSSLALSVLRTDHPSIPGIKISSTTASGCISIAILIPNGPSSAINTPKPSLSSCRFMRSRTVGSSSIISIVCSAFEDNDLSASPKTTASYLMASASTFSLILAFITIDAVKVVPSPSTLLTSTSPPIILLKCLVIIKPRPVPPYLRVVELSACVNA